MKKAQMEILGLAMIVLLMSVGILFVIKFVFLTPSESPRATFTQKQIAQNFLSSLVQTNTPCSGASVADLMEDCGRSYSELSCEHNGNIYDSCTYAQIVIDEMLQGTVAAWNQNYHLIGEAPDGSNIFVEHGWPLAVNPPYEFPPALYNTNPDRTGEKQVKSHPISLYPEPGVILLKLELYPS